MDGIAGVFVFLEQWRWFRHPRLQDESAMVVGRIYYIEGDLLGYVPAEKDWVAVVRDAPSVQKTHFFSGSRGMAELIVPNGNLDQDRNSTQIQFITLDTDLAEMDVASGVARFYNKGSNTVIKSHKPFGYSWPIRARSSTST